MSMGINANSSYGAGTGYNSTGVSKKEDSTSSTNKSKNSGNLAKFDSNKRYHSLSEFANDLFALEKKWQVQYKELTADSEINTIEDLKKQIEELFPEYKLVSSRPRDVVQGKNLLYIDDRNLQKMLNDPSYRTDVYALMRRELAAAPGWRIGDDKWRLTGSVFTLSDDNPRVGGIPYLGMCTSMKVNSSNSFSAKSNKVNIFSATQKAKEKKAKKKAAEKKKKEQMLKDIWEKERAKKKEFKEQLQRKASENKEKRNRYNRQQVAKKYEKQLYGKK